MRRSSSNQSKPKFLFRITVPSYGIDTTLYFDNYKCKKVGFRLTVVCAMTRFNHVVMTDLSKATLTLVMAAVCYMLSVLASTDVRDLRIPNIALAPKKNGCSYLQLIAPPKPGTFLFYCV